MKNRRKKFSPKTIILFLLITLLITVMVVFLYKNFTLNLSTSATAFTVQNPDEAIQQLEKRGQDYGFQNALSDLSEKSTTTIDGDSYYRLQQNYKGIPVYGKTLVCATDEKGNVTSITGNVGDVDTSISLSPTISSEQAAEAICNYLTKNFGYDVPDLPLDLSTGESLCIYSAEDSQECRLAYCMNIGIFEIVIDGNNADVLSVSQTVFEDIESATGYMASDIKETNGFSIEKRGEYYYVMRDASKGLTVYTFDDRISQDDTEFHQNRASIVESTDEIFGNTKAEKELEYEKGAQLMLHAAGIHQYFANLGFSAKAIDTRLFYNDGYDNGKNALGGKVDGHGVISMGSVTGVNCVDVIAHEYTHFVSRELVGWIGSAENGALNEAISDIFGEIIESNISGKEINWTMDRFRDIAQPNVHNNPNFYKGDNWGDISNPNRGNDYGYVHNNSTVISHAAYLMWHGINGDSTKKISTDNLAKLWYRAMLMMPADCNFAECRKLVELSASSMRLTDSQLACIHEAFDKVGIFNAEDVTVDYELTPDCELSVIGKDGEPYDNYTVTISGHYIFGSYAKDQPLYVYNHAEYNKTSEVTTSDPFVLPSIEGVYAVTISDNVDIEKQFSFTVRIGNKSAKHPQNTLEVYTGFGGTVTVPDIFTQLPEIFSCITASGRADWKLLIKNDGSFDSIYKIIDMGECGPEYPNGTWYIKEEAGNFTEFEKIDEFSYRMVADSIEKTAPAGETYITDTYRYIVEDGTQVTNKDVFYLYLPGTPYSKLPQDLIESVNNNGFHSMDEITPSTYILYYPTPESNGYDLVFIATSNESISEETRIQLNHFLSYFSEQWFHEGDTFTNYFDAEKPDPVELIRFSHLYNYLYNFDMLIDTLDENFQVYHTIDQINKDTQRFFGTTASYNDVTSDEFEIKGQKVYFPFGMGDTFNCFTLVDEVINLPDGTILVTFNIYEAGRTFGAAPGLNLIDEVYTFTVDEANATSDLKFRTSGTAIISPNETESSFYLKKYGLSGQSPIEGVSAYTR